MSHLDISIVLLLIHLVVQIRSNYINCTSYSCQNKQQCDQGEDCTIQCTGSNSCRTATLLCPKDYKCTIQCIDEFACSNATINASLSSELTLNGCIDPNACSSLDIYCPAHTNKSKQCKISGNNIRNDVHFFAIHGFSDLDVNYTGDYALNNAHMFCLTGYTQSCAVAPDSFLCDPSGDATCNGDLSITTTSETTTLFTTSRDLDPGAIDLLFDLGSIYGIDILYFVIIALLLLLLCIGCLLVHYVCKANQQKNLLKLQNIQMKKVKTISVNAQTQPSDRDKTFDDHDPDTGLTPTITPFSPTAEFQLPNHSGSNLAPTSPISRSRNSSNKMYRNRCEPGTNSKKLNRTTSNSVNHQQKTSKNAYNANGRARPNSFAVSSGYNTGPSGPYVHNNASPRSANTNQSMKTITENVQSGPNYQQSQQRAYNRNHPQHRQLNYGSHSANQYRNPHQPQHPHNTSLPSVHSNPVRQVIIKPWKQTNPNQRYAQNQQKQNPNQGNDLSDASSTVMTSSDDSSESSSDDVQHRVGPPPTTTNKNYKMKIVVDNIKVKQNGDIPLSNALQYLNQQKQLGVIGSNMAVDGSSRALGDTATPSQSGGNDTPLTMVIHGNDTPNTPQTMVIHGQQTPNTQDTPRSNNTPGTMLVHNEDSSDSSDSSSTDSDSFPATEYPTEQND
eukprot:181852_1